MKKKNSKINNISSDHSKKTSVINVNNNKLISKQQQKSRIVTNNNNNNIAKNDNTNDNNDISSKVTISKQCFHFNSTNNHEMFFCLECSLFLCKDCCENHYLTKTNTFSFNNKLEKKSSTHIIERLNDDTNNKNSVNANISNQINFILDQLESNITNSHINLNDMFRSNNIKLFTEKSLSIKSTLIKIAESFSNIERKILVFNNVYSGFKTKLNLSNSTKERDEASILNFILALKDISRLLLDTNRIDASKDNKNDNDDISNIGVNDKFNYKDYALFFNSFIINYTELESIGVDTVNTLLLNNSLRILLDEANKMIIEDNYNRNQEVVIDNNDCNDYNVFETKTLTGLIEEFSKDSNKNKEVNVRKLDLNKISSHARVETFTLPEEDSKTIIEDSNYNFNDNFLNETVDILKSFGKDNKITDNSFLYDYNYNANTNHSHVNKDTNAYNNQDKLVVEGLNKEIHNKNSIIDVKNELISELKNKISYLEKEIDRIKKDYTSENRSSVATLKSNPVVNDSSKNNNVIVAKAKFNDSCFSKNVNDSFSILKNNESDNLNSKITSTAKSAVNTIKNIEYHELCKEDYLSDNYYNNLLSIHNESLIINKNISNSTNTYPDSLLINLANEILKTNIETNAIKDFSERRLLKTNNLLTLCKVTPIKLESSKSKTNSSLSYSTTNPDISTGNNNNNNNAKTIIEIKNLIDYDKLNQLVKEEIEAHINKVILHHEKAINSYLETQLKRVLFYKNNPYINQLTIFSKNSLKSIDLKSCEINDNNLIDLSLIISSYTSLHSSKNSIINELFLQNNNITDYGVSMFLRNLFIKEDSSVPVIRNIYFNNNKMITKLSVVVFEDIVDKAYSSGNGSIVSSLNEIKLISFENNKISDMKDSSVKSIVNKNSNNKIISNVETLSSKSTIKDTNIINTVNFGFKNEDNEDKRNTSGMSVKDIVKKIKSKLTKTLIKV